MIDNEILPSTRPPGMSLAFLNKLLRCVGLVLVISIDTDGDGRITGTETRLWIEQAKRYESRTND